MKKPNLTNRTADRIYRMITESGEYEVGSRMPTEAQLTQMLGVSRTTLREAMRILSAKGIVRIRPGSGTYVTMKPDEISYGDVLGSIQELDSVWTTLQNLFELRFALVPLAAKLACRRGTDDELEELCAAIDAIIALLSADFAAAYRDGRYRDAVLAFHRRLSAATHNQALERLLNDIHAAYVSAVTESAINKALTLDSEPILLNYRTLRSALRSRMPQSVYHAAMIGIMLNEESAGFDLSECL